MATAPLNMMVDLRELSVITTGMPIDSIGMSVINGIEEIQFHILTHPFYNTSVEKRVKEYLYHDHFHTSTNLLKSQNPSDF